MSFLSLFSAPVVVGASESLTSLKCEKRIGLLPLPFVLSCLGP